MKTVALSAHFDGKKIELDEPYPLSEDARLVVVVLPQNEERDDWLRLSAQQLARVYGDGEPEYTEADLRKRTKGTWSLLGLLRPIAISRIVRCSASVIGSSAASALNFSGA